MLMFLGSVVAVLPLSWCLLEVSRFVRRSHS